jgi:hypothetical protein
MKVSKNTFKTKSKYEFIQCQTFQWQIFEFYKFSVLLSEENTNILILAFNKRDISIQSIGI